MKAPSHLGTVLSALLALALAVIAAETPASPPAPKAAAPAAAFKNVDAAQFDKLRKEPNTVVLDVRTPTEYAAGHIQGAVLIDFKAADFAKQIAKLDKSKTYLVHCAGGVRSSKACSQMAGLGFTSLVNLEKGFTDWQATGKPVEK